MEALVENELLGLRFFSSGQDPNPRDDLDKTRERLELLLQSIGLLKMDYSHEKEVEVNNCIRAGAFVNAKSPKGITPLHCAALHGYTGVVNVLLQNTANPNKGDHEGLTPLHYAAKFSHLKVVQALLSYYAMYNAVSDDGKTPSDLTTNESITSLFNLVSRSFEDIGNGNSKFISDLYKIKDTDTVKAVMCAQNRENATLVVAAMHSKFSQVQHLKEILHTLNTRSTIARVLFYQGKDEEAFNIFQEVHRKQNEVIGLNHTDTLDTQIYMAKILNNQGKYEKSLHISRLVIEKCKNDDEICMLAQKNIANIFHKQGDTEEALKIYREILEKEKLGLGINHLTTALTLNRITGILFKQNKFCESLKIHQEFLNNWKNSLGPNHPHIFDTQCIIGFTFICQQKWISLQSLKLEAYRVCFDQIKAFDGPNDIKVVEISKDLDRIKMMFFLHSSEPWEILRQQQKSINNEALN